MQSRLFTNSLCLVPISHLHLNYKRSHSSSRFCGIQWCHPATFNHDANHICPTVKRLLAGALLLGQEYDLLPKRKTSVFYTNVSSVRIPLSHFWRDWNNKQVPRTEASGRLPVWIDKGCIVQERNPSIPGLEYQCDCGTKSSRAMANEGQGGNTLSLRWCTLTSGGTHCTLSMDPRAGAGRGVSRSQNYLRWLAVRKCTGGKDY